MPAPDLSAIEHRYADVNGIRMHYVEAGSGPLVVLLHGFPELWYSWRHQIAALAPYYHVVAPDQRGYNETERHGPFDTDTLQADVIALIRHLGAERAHVIAHDWGAAVAWLLAMNHPQVVESLVICNVPHPVIFGRAVRKPPQLVRSWYVLFFQLPCLPEWTLSARNYQLLAASMIHQCRPGTFTREDVATFLAAWRRHGLGGGIDWYRGLFRTARALAKPAPLILAPTTLIWGTRDRYLGRELTEGTDDYVRDFQLHLIEGVSHWVQQEAPEEVNRLILAHLERVTA